MTDETLSEERIKLYQSEMAYNILWVFNTAGSKELYSKEVTEKLHDINIETSRKSVSNYIKRLRDAGFLQRGKRNKAQYYRIDFNGVYDNWVEYVLYRLEKSEIDKEASIERITEQLDELDKATEDFDRDNAVEIIEDTFGGFNEEINEKRTQFIEAATEDEKVKEFFLTYVLHVLDTPGYNIHDLYTRFLFRELLLLQWRVDDFNQSLSSILGALSGCLLDESDVVGKGTIAYEEVYGEVSITYPQLMELPEKDLNG